ncbi:hypothetical protein MEN41_04510 [Dolichospermum sp. ST_con]|nr:hypothetical protein [Dolichospermum sp. ST_con]MDD1419502.1 hypothetical protein [Dolichospermum sp. ST_sed1]MDD1425055.1 hypothetical protein [Dolichospermum sp. ST_sed9]MDD1431127.1 hypothetical protein [Dolichospermum sp. ST_sed6]MDD1438062.1 hypothetical protein [Dolichospermum sp. ST_sed10]MDD1439509.1 hypothetical protein [Dolichospermum sp. ST_sed3]MDD1445270.1 hypothetical protein [Dolichospermum sp. ST_sed8]MDD1455846.1 hypothetical protein [Dolichospermum sp. ST_sed7]MDD146055
MDNLQKTLLEQINLNLQGISSYIENLSREEIKLDSNQIFLIDYSTYKWLNTLPYQDIITRLEEYNQKSVNAIMKNDFVEYCRQVYLQIEILLDKLISLKFGQEKTEDNNYTKIKKLKDCFKLVRGGERNFQSHEDKEYNLITYIMTIRDIVSHTNFNGKSLAERVESQGKVIEIKLTNLEKMNSNVDLYEQIKIIFSEFVIDKKWLKIYYKNGETYAFITMYKLKDTYFLVNSDLVLKHKLFQSYFSCLLN